MRAFASYDVQASHDRMCSIRCCVIISSVVDGPEFVYSTEYIVLTPAQAMHDDASHDNINAIICLQSPKNSSLTVSFPACFPASMFTTTPHVTVYFVCLLWSNDSSGFASSYVVYVGLLRGLRNRILGLISGPAFAPLLPTWPCLFAPKQPYKCPRSHRRPPTKTSSLQRPPTKSPRCQNVSVIRGKRASVNVFC